MLWKKLMSRTGWKEDHRVSGLRVFGDAIEGGWDSSENNERTAPRYEARLIVSIEVGDDAYVGFTENVSESGLFVATEAPQQVGAEVNLLIALPDLALVRARGTVRWLRAPGTKGVVAGMGIRFDQLTPLDAVRIHEFVLGRRSRMIMAQGASLRSAS
jgi:uncharacterized protein (TIGR02266 family)